MPTPHISAPDGAFASTVLLPGDPLRAKWVAEHFLDDAELVTEVRNIFGYTGTWNGHPVSVMGTGMGVPSISIYATELIDEYGCERLIRVGSCGALVESVGLRDVVIGAGACTDSGVNRIRFGGFDFAAIADWALLRSTVEAAERGSAPVHVGNILTSDLFYSPQGEEVARMAASMGVLAVEMEAAGLYGVAAERGAKALAICTVSDHLVLEEELSSDDRQRSFSDMIEIALGGAFT
ncbi:MAG: purine-nucleoside phosphorylase [Actinomycetota bacterium]